jgi:hypothetical protein
VKNSTVGHHARDRREDLLAVDSAPDHVKQDSTPTTTAYNTPNTFGVFSLTMKWLRP